LEEKAIATPAGQPFERQQRLMFGTKARENAETGRNKGVFVAMVLEDLDGRGRLKQAV
jgi:hypothetical protein